MAKTTQRAMLMAKDLETVRKAQVRAVLKKAASGKVLTSREEQVLQAATQETPRKPKTDEEARVWLTPSELIRYLARSGIRISRKNLYKTYIGEAAPHPVHKSPDGRLIHREKALEMVRLVQGRETVDLQNALAKKHEADARIREARARKEEIELAEMEGQKIDVELVMRVVQEAYETLKNELKALDLSLPDELDGKSRPEQRDLIKARHNAALKHVKGLFMERAAQAQEVVA